MTYNNGDFPKIIIYICLTRQIPISTISHFNFLLSRSTIWYSSNKMALYEGGVLKNTPKNFKTKNKR